MTIIQYIPATLKGNFQRKITKNICVASMYIKQLLNAKSET